MRHPSAQERIALALAEHEPRPRRQATPAAHPGDRDGARAHGAQVIAAGLRSLGADDPEDIQDENGFYHFRFGTIQCALGMVSVEDRDLFLVYAPIMDLPSDRELLLPLYRLLLELNNRFELGAAKFGIHSDTVFLSAMRPLDGLDAVEVEDMIRWVSRFADNMDERLVAEFGGTSKLRGSGA